LACGDVDAPDPSSYRPLDATRAMSEAKKPFNNPFAALEARRAELAPGVVAPPPTPAATHAAPAKPEAPRGPARAVVRLEKKGRRGKEVTVIEHLNLSPADLEVWLKALKAGLGCGGVIEGNALALQGDQRARVEPLLVSRGVRKITIA
jgi:translation initiation factor 1